jgi:hypothetical protein
MKPIRRRVPSYVSKIAALHERARAMGRMPRGIYAVDVFHDHGCPLLAGRGECTCDAELGEVRPVVEPEVA